jgi:hypothetical protein
LDTIIEAKVQYTLSYIKRCRCSLCPFQADSECAQEKYSKLKNEYWKVQKELKMWSLKRFLEHTVR